MNERKERETLNENMDVCVYVAIYGSCITANFLDLVLRSKVKVAERSGQSVHERPNLDAVTSVAHVDDVAEKSLARWRLVGPGNVTIVASVQLALTVTGLGVERLPRV